MADVQEIIGETKFWADAVAQDPGQDQRVLDTQLAKSATEAGRFRRDCKLNVLYGITRDGEDGWGEPQVSFHRLGVIY